MKNKKLKIGVVIPYLPNSEKAVELFCELYKKIQEIKTSNIIVEIFYEDLNNVVGLSKARNICIDNLMKKKVDYIMFLDADDMIDDDFFEKIYSKCLVGYDIIEARFKILSSEVEYQQDKMNNHVTGICYKASVIGNNRFDETLQFGEDGEFTQRVIDLSKYTKCQANTFYHYNYGYNKDCLSYRFSRGEITEKFIK